MKRFINKILGIDKLVAMKLAAKQELIQSEKALADAIVRIEKDIADSALRAEEAIAREAVALESERISKLTPKELANENKEAWISVLDTHIDEDNLRNGFFELDWNSFFVLKLQAAGYPGNTDEEVVNSWFNELCRNIGKEENVSMDRRGSGYINVSNLGGGRTAVS